MFRLRSVSSYAVGFFGLLGLCAGIFLLGNAGLAAAPTSQGSPLPAGARRSLYPQEWGIARPAGLAYAARFRHFFLLDQTRGALTRTTVVTITPYEELVDRVEIDFNAGDAMNMAYDEQGRRLLLLNQKLTEIAQVTLDEQGRLNPATLRRSPLTHLRLANAQGMAVDVSGERLLILDKAARRVVSLPLHATLDFPAEAVTTIELSALGPAALRGLAIHPATGHLFIGSPPQRLLYEISQRGEVINQYATETLALSEPQAFVFAPSADLTDAPDTIHLFIADSHLPNAQAAAVDLTELPVAGQVYLPLITAQKATESSEIDHSEETTGAAAKQPGKGRLGEIVEVALDWSPEVVAAAANPPIALTLVQSVNTGAFSPPSPDPAGIAFIPPLNRLLISDSEVNEMPTLFTGANLFETSPAGNLFRTGSTVAYSIEPTGVAYNPTNGHLFISDDDKRRIFEVAPGADGLYGTPDDSITSFRTSLFNSFDPEGVTYDPNAGVLFIVDGVNNEVYRVSPGANGHFDGIPAEGGDDMVTNFDVQILNIFDPEGIHYDTESGHLFLVGNNRARLYEITTTGNLVQLYDTSVAQILKNAGVTLAPGSNNPNVLNFYIVDRGIDNDIDPTENDGKLHELSRPIHNPTETPTPASTPTATPTLEETPTPPADLIFADDFEAGNLAAWSSSNTDGGNLSVSTAAALQGSTGLQALINDNVSIYVIDESPNAETRYRARFYFAPNAITMASGDAHYLLIGYDAVPSAPKRVLYVDFRFAAGSYQLRLRQQDDSELTRSTSWVTISDEVHAIELDWQAATAAGANNGSLTLWIDGVQRGALTALDNDTRRIDQVRLGAASEIDTGTRGIYYLDAFESRRQSYIGP